MSNAYIRAAGHVPTQKEKAKPNQVVNNAGGYVFQVTDETRLERFLILGTTGGTYYQNEQDITKQNMDFIKAMIHNTPDKVISKIREIATERRALRQSPAIFATALLMSELKNINVPTLSEREFTYSDVKQLVLDVCKTATQLFEFISYLELLGGWSRAKRTAVARWYIEKSTDSLAYQMVKYRQRNGFTHADAIRLSKASIDSDLAKFAKVHYNAEANLELAETSYPDIVEGFIRAQHCTTESELLRVMKAYPKLPWEAFPTQLLKSPKVWRQLFESGALRNQALIRNITRLARLDMFKDLRFARDYADKLLLEAKGLHPLNFLNALIVHESGQVDRKNSGWYATRNKDWQTSNIIRDSLNDGFYAAFRDVVPSGKRIMLALDVSGSMSALASGLDMSCAQLTAAMAMAISRVETTYMIMGFTHNFVDLEISSRDDLGEALAKVQRNNFGRTDCAVPMQWAAKHHVDIDTFVVLTDNETWYGTTHPYKALQQYRQQTGINAGQIVVAATATPFTIADPSDSKTLDVVGADANLPALVSNFC